MVATLSPDATMLTASLEDYLEAIYLVSESRDGVRPKDIVERMKVRGASVTGALRTLAERGFVRHAPYDLVTLTPEGKAAARDVVHRHTVLQDFLVRILGFAPDAADEAACRLEHDVSPDILDRLAQLADFIKGCPRTESAEPTDIIAEGAPVPACASCNRTFPEALKPATPSPPPLTLKDLKPGDKGIVRKITTRSAALRRIAEMGVTVGTSVSVVRIAPLGDPIDIRVKGYQLSLRKTDAEGIVVERPAGDTP